MLWKVIPSQQRFLSVEENFHLKSFLFPLISRHLISWALPAKQMRAVHSGLEDSGHDLTHVSDAFTPLCLRPKEKAWAVASLVIWVLLPAAHRLWDLGPVLQAPLWASDFHTLTWSTIASWKATVRHRNQGMASGSVGKGTCCSTWGHEFDSWAPHSGREPTLASCLLTPTCNKYKNKLMFKKKGGVSSKAWLGTL